MDLYNMQTNNVSSYWSFTPIGEKISLTDEEKKSCALKGLSLWISSKKYAQRKKILNKLLFYKLKVTPITLCCVTPVLHSLDFYVQQELHRLKVIDDCTNITFTISTF